MRAGRGMKQLWEERVRFLKYERGVAEQFPRKSKAAAEQRRMEEQEDIKDLVDLDLRKRLEAVEVFYVRSAMVTCFSTLTRDTEAGSSSPAIGGSRSVESLAPDCDHTSDAIGVGDSNRVAQCSN